MGLETRTLPISATSRVHEWRSAELLHEKYTIRSPLDLLERIFVNVGRKERDNSTVAFKDAPGTTDSTDSIGSSGSTDSIDSSGSTDSIGSSIGSMMRQFKVGRQMPFSIFTKRMHGTHFSIFSHVFDFGLYTLSFCAFFLCLFFLVPFFLGWFGLVCFGFGFVSFP